MLSNFKSIEKKEIKRPVMGRYSMKSPKTSQLKVNQVELTKVSEINLKASQKILKTSNSKPLLPP